MKKSLFATLIYSSIAFPISVGDANKFLDQYEGMTQKMLGLVNCLSKAITGENAINSINGKPVEELTEGTPGLTDCLNIAGIKTGAGMSKISKGTTTPSEVQVVLTPEPEKNILKEVEPKRDITSLPVPPTEKKEQSNLKSTVKTVW